MAFVVAICGYAFVRLFVLGFGFFGLDLVDLDAVFGVGEVEIHGECVAAADVPAFGRLG